MEVKTRILSEDKMRELGFTDYAKDRWFFFRFIKFPRTSRYKYFEISFSLTIPKNGDKTRLDVLDEDFCQPYDYEMMLEKNPNFEPAKIVKEQVDYWINHLKDNGIVEEIN